MLLTVDYPSSHREQKVPVLDLKVFTEGDQIHHEFYEKPCAAKQVIPYKSAHSRKMKMAVLVEEGLRSSGYPETVRHDVIKTSFQRWDKMCEEEACTQARDWKSQKRRMEKERKASCEHKGLENQVSAPLILEPTGGSLTKGLKDVCAKFEQLTGMMVAVLERAGNSIKHITKSEPLQKKGCGREDCFSCSTEGEKCEKNGAGYRIRCKTCLRAGRSAEYIGETGRNSYTRGLEHLAALRL